MEPMRISAYTLYISSMQNVIGLHFPTNDIGLSSLKFFWWAPEFLLISAFRRSRSSKVNEFGANRKHVCDFLLVRNSNFGLILHRFGPTARFMCFWPHPYSTLILEVFPSHQIAHIGRQRAHGLQAIRPWNYFRRIPIYVITVPKRHQSTDRQTAGRHAIS